MGSQRGSRVRSAYKHLTLPHDSRDDFLDAAERRSVEVCREAQLFGALWERFNLNEVEITRSDWPEALAKNLTITTY